MQSRECLQNRDYDAAESSLRRALQVQPDLSDAYELLGKLLYRDGRSDEAAALYEQWLQAVPAHPVAAHLVAATGGAPVPARASDAFVTSLYRRAAPDFDTTAEALGYRAPQLLHECASEALGSNWHCNDVVDLGCGTGLCGALLRPHAGQLTGVDLSPEMLRQAGERGCYDRLVRAELTEFLRNDSRPLDLVMAADVFCYFGELAPTYTAVSDRLRSGGRFVFSLEALDEHDGGSGTQLLRHGRYAHHLDYIHAALGAAGLGAQIVRRDILRFERGAPVEGWILAALKRD